MTRRVQVGGVPMGGGARVSVQVDDQHRHAGR